MAIYPEPITLKIPLWLAVIVGLFISLTSRNSCAESFIFHTDTISYAINSNGLNSSLQQISTGKNWLAAPTPFTSVTKAGTTYPASELRRDGDELSAIFGKSGISAAFRISAHATHITIELVSLNGPVPDSITLCSLTAEPFAHTGTVIAAHWNDDITICLMALSERVNSQVKSRNSLSATVYHEFGMVGEKVALIAVPTDSFLDVVQVVEKTYGLPSPTIDGVWAKQSPDVDTNYLFVDVSEHTAEKVIAWAKLGGFQYVLIPWRSWAASHGSYPINTKNFPKEEESLKYTIDKFHAAGLKVGMHMMTSLIGKNDPLVRPKPDPRLLKNAVTVLADEIDAIKTTISAKNDLVAFSDDVRKHNYDVDKGIDIQIDDEIIFCKETSRSSPYVYSNCQRGAYGTIKKAHKAGTTIYRLVQGAGAYMADLNTSLKDQIANRIAEVANHCEFDMIYFDGGELSRANGPPWYYVGLQQTAIWKRMKRDMLFQGSGRSHWLWHIISRRTCDDHAAVAVKSFMDYHKLDRMKNYRSNFIPAELGWCGLLAGGPDHPATTVGDIEHYGTRMIAYDVPISIQTSLEKIESNPRSADILEQLKRINKFRSSGIITELQREHLKSETWSLFDNSGTRSIKSVKPEKIQSYIEDPQTVGATLEGRVLFQGNIKIVPEASWERSPWPGAMIASIFFRALGATERDCRGPRSGEDAKCSRTLQDLIEYQALAATILVSNQNKSNSLQNPVLNIQLEDKYGRYRDHYLDLNFTGEKTVIIPKTNVQRLLPEFGRPAYKIKMAMRYFDYSKVAAINLRWMRKPRNTDMAIFLKKLVAVPPQKIISGTAQDDL